MEPVDGPAPWHHVHNEATAGSAAGGVNRIRQAQDGIASTAAGAWGKINEHTASMHRTIGFHRCTARAGRPAEGEDGTPRGRLQETEHRRHGI